MAHGWTTKKTAAGYAWTVSRTIWDAALGRAVSTTLKSGVSSTRARASGHARRWVTYYRRGGQPA